MPGHDHAARVRRPLLLSSVILAAAALPASPPPTWSSRPVSSPPHPADPQESAERIASAGGAPGAPAEPEIVLEGRPDGIALRELIERAREATGEPFYFVPADVEDERICFVGTARIPRDRFLAFFGACLRANDYVLLHAVVGGVRLHEIRRLGQQARGQWALKTLARVVTPDELREIADHRELVTTTWSSKHAPHRGFDHAVCVYFSDSTIQSISSIEGTGIYVMTGIASEIADRMDLMDRLDASLAGTATDSEDDLLAHRVTRLEAAVAELQRETSDGK